MQHGFGEYFFQEECLPIETNTDLLPDAEYVMWQEDGYYQQVEHHQSQADHQKIVDEGKGRFQVHGLFPLFESVGDASYRETGKITVNLLTQPAKLPVHQLRGKQ